jgi:phosphohistidine phosphatase
MSLELLVMRHAKSSWELGYASDYQRPLNERGISDAPRMAHWLVAQHKIPELIFSSPAVRAAETTRLLTAEFPSYDSKQVIFCEELYHGAPRHYLRRLACLEGTEVRRAMVVGHNPGLEQLVYQLSGDPQHLPTASVVCLRLEIDHWGDIWDQRQLIGDKAIGRLLAIGRPKEIFGKSAGD